MNTQALEWSFDLSLDFSDVQTSAIVGGVGALGGAAAVASATYLGYDLIIVGSYGIFLSMVLGTVASIIFVFLIANTDRTDLNRLIAISLISGFSWQPVLETGKQFVAKTYEKSAITDLQTSLSGAFDMIEHSATTQTPLDTKTFYASWHETLKNVKYVNSYDARNEVNDLISRIATHPELPTDVANQLRFDVIKNNLLSADGEQLMLAKITASDFASIGSDDFSALIAGYLSEQKGTPVWSEKAKTIDIHRFKRDNSISSKFFVNLENYCESPIENKSSDAEVCRTLKVYRSAGVLDGAQTVDRTGG